jgi:SPP1 gp7 family putative phage head morphogenesis protein
MSKMATQFEVEVRHAILTQRFAKGQAQIITDSLAKVERRVRDVLGGGNVKNSTELHKIISAINKTAAHNLTISSNAIIRDSRDFAFAEARFERDVLDIFGRSPLRKTSLPKKDYVASRAVARPAVGVPTKEALREYNISVIGRIVDTLRQGIDSKLSNEQIISQIRGTRANNFNDGLMAKFARQAESLTRTISASVSSEAKQIEAVRAGAGWARIIATLDSRTTVICMRQDGRVYKIEDAVLPPYHYGCRSTVTYYYSEEEAMDVGGSRASKGDAPRQIDADTTYNEFLKEQSVEFQNEALGETRAELFRSGLSVDKFTSATLEPLTLAELQRMHPLVFDKAGISA